MNRCHLLIGIYTLLAVSLVGFGISVLLRRPNAYSTGVDGWLVDAIEFGAVSLCFARGITHRPSRAFAFTLGAAFLLWNIGDVVRTIESFGGATPPSPSLADVFYLAFYPVTYIAVMLYARSQLQRGAGPSWLDGAIVSLGTVALCSAFALHGLDSSTGTKFAASATNLAYPIGDLTLLGIVVGCTAVLPKWNKAMWLGLSGGLGVVVIGDTANLFQKSLELTRGGSFFNAVAWPTAVLIIAGVLWMKERPANPLVALPSSGFALPGVAAAVALGIVFASTLHPIGKVTVSLAAATLVLVSVRIGISMRSLRQLSQERFHLAHTDELTGLSNRRHLLELLDGFFTSEERREESADGLAFLFVDLNHFKEINDSFGHPAGDEVLRQLGPRLRGGLRNSDIVFRLGGDEFVVLLFGCDLKYATDVAERLTKNLEEPFVVASVNTSVSASIGIGIAPIDASDAMRLMWCADMAMYRAKLTGEPYAVYGQWLDRANHLQLADDLRMAIEKRHLVLHYQTQLDLHSNEILGVEALVRWDHPQLGMIPPLRFLPLAEEAGLMGALSRYILDTALAQCAAWRAIGRNQVMSVNISPTNLLEPGFSDLVRELMALHQISPEFLVLEVTETCIISDFERCRQVIKELRAIGIVFSIDDFGAGATSLAYLGNLGAGELKLDVCFVQGLSGPDKDRDLELVRATIDLGHAMGLRVVAEGIEDAKALELLVELGCDVAQGFFISKPVPAENLAFNSDLEFLDSTALTA